MAIIEDKKKVVITDVNLIAPELMNKSLEQLRREIAERKMAIEEIVRLEEEKERTAKMDEASSRIDRVIEDMKWLEANKFLSDNVKGKFLGKDRAGGEYFAPHLSFRKPTK